MQKDLVLYWVRNFLALTFIVIGLWLVLFLDSNNLQAGSLLWPYKNFLTEYNFHLGLSVFCFGVAFAAGPANLARIIAGFVFLMIGVMMMAYFQPLRHTWIGQVLTNFGAPALMILGIFVMVKFQSDVK